MKFLERLISWGCMQGGSELGQDRLVQGEYQGRGEPCVLAF